MRLQNSTAGQTRLFGHAPQSDNLIANPVAGAGIDQVAQVSKIQFLQSLPVSEDLRSPTPI